MTRVIHHCKNNRHGFTCGGKFKCAGCGRVVGWCFGCSDALGEEHCDDCRRDRLALLHGVALGYRTKSSLRFGTKASNWLRKPLVVADELREDGFLDFKRNGQFVLT